MIRAARSPLAAADAQSAQKSVLLMVSLALEAAHSLCAGEGVARCPQPYESITARAPCDLTGARRGELGELESRGE